MEPTELNVNECDFYKGVVPADNTVRSYCRPMVIERYLAVQLQSTNYLTLCEVTTAAGRYRKTRI